MRVIRVGNGCGFWGDNVDAPLRLVDGVTLDYLTLEYLAELTMSILAVQKEKKPEAGYATDFLDVLKRLAPRLKVRSSLKIITNAGGMNARACALKAREILKEAGLAGKRVAVVTGDDLMPAIDSLLNEGITFAHFDTRAPFAPIRSSLVSANAYLGAEPIVKALKQGAEIVITGRVADASLTVAPAVHELGWSWNNWDRLAAGIVAGHLIECGAQVTGGLWTNIDNYLNLASVGYPVAEISEDGVVTITKPDNTGGAVNRETVSEQLLYEVGDPTAYITPDGVADFTSVKLFESGKDRVTLSEIRGKPATDSYKVSMAYRDGYTASGTLVIAGWRGVEKAKTCGDIIWQRLAAAGYTYEKQLAEVIGGADPHLGFPPSEQCIRGAVLRVSVKDPRRDAVERFTRELAPLVTSGPAGVTGYTSGRPPVREVFAYWPTLIPKNRVTSEIEFIE